MYLGRIKREVEGLDQPRDDDLRFDLREGRAEAVARAATKR